MSGLTAICAGDHYSYVLSSVFLLLAYHVSNHGEETGVESRQGVLS